MALHNSWKHTLDNIAIIWIDTATLGRVTVQQQQQQAEN